MRSDRLKEYIKIAIKKKKFDVVSTLRLPIVRDPPCPSTMSAENGIQPRKPLRRTGVAKRRVKTIVRDVNGSTGMFRYFYQNGGRDYDQYRLWLQDVSKSTAAPTPSGFLIELGKIKEEYVSQARRSRRTAAGFV